MTIGRNNSGAKRLTSETTRYRSQSVKAYVTCLLRYIFDCLTHIQNLAMIELCHGKNVIIYTPEPKTHKVS